MKEKFARWHILFVEYLKRDWKKIFIWVVALGLFSGGFVPVFEELAEGDGLWAMYETFKNPAMISIVGPTPAQTAADYTLGAMYEQEMLLFSALFAMTLSILHVIGHTRKEEDLGLTELVRSFQIGRQANSLAVIAETIFINALLAVFIGAIMAGFRAEAISPGGSFLFGGTVGMAGIMGGAIALLLAQIMPVSSAATGSSFGFIGLLYIIRGGTDISSPCLSMLNPLGWVYLTHPFTENNWLPMGLAAIFSLFLISAAFALEGSRDMGAGYLRLREGRARAKKSLLSVPGLFLRLNKGVIMGWLASFFILGAAYGSIYGDMEVFLAGNEMIERLFSHAGFTVEESFTGTIMLVMAGLVTILPIAVVNRLFAEERGLYLSQLFGTKVRRSTLYWTCAALAIVSGACGLLLAAGGIGLAAVSAMEKGSLRLYDFVAVGYSFLPTVLFFTGLAAFALGWLPRLGRLVYVYLAYSFFLNYFESLLDLPNWLAKTAPQSWLPKMPMERFDLKIFLLVTLLGALLMVTGWLGYLRRDMVEGA